MIFLRSLLPIIAINNILLLFLLYYISSFVILLFILSVKLGTAMSCGL